MLNKFKSKIKIQDDKTENVLQIQKIKIIMVYVKIGYRLNQ